jgi:2-amino-4-hydroxy-6-hydroxymethyldihydropteridine diphosphokinase
VIPVRVAIALGSNLGPRERHLLDAAEALRATVDDLRLSSLLETEPVGVPPQPRFLNAAAAGQTRLTARALLDELLRIEAAQGRERPHPGAPRTLDLDLILYGEAVLDEPGLQVPHPRFRERRFVLEPLTAVAADMRDPVSGLTVSELLERL